MKKTHTLLFLLMLIGIATFSQNDLGNPLRKEVLTELANRSTNIFEGKVLTRNKSFWGKGSQIHTSFTIEVTEILLGNIQKGTIEIILSGGQLERDGIVYDQDIRGLCAGYSTFFCEYSTLSSGLADTNSASLSMVDNICYNSKGEISPPSGDVNPYFVPFKNIKELYIELNKIKPISIPR